MITKGGIPLNGITEIAGESGVGKTQLCLQLALMEQLPLHLNGKNKSVVYISTEDIFPAKRFNQMVKEFRSKFNIHSVEFEDNMFLKHAADFHQLLKCLKTQLPSLLKVKRVGLVIIDSIAGLFRAETVNSYSTRSKQFLQIIQELNSLNGKNIFIVCVNQVTDNIQIGKTEPCLGLSWSNLISSRFFITRDINSKLRKFSVLFAPNLPNKTCCFSITQQGIEDC